MVATLELYTLVNGRTWLWFVNKETDKEESGHSDIQQCPCLTFEMNRGDRIEEDSSYTKCPCPSPLLLSSSNIGSIAIHSAHNPPEDLVIGIGIICQCPEEHESSADSSPPESLHSSYNVHPYFTSDLPKDIKIFLLTHRVTMATLMPKVQSSLRLTLYKMEKTQWRNEAKKLKVTLSQFVRMVMNARLHICTDDLVKKLDCKKSEQTSIYDNVSSRE